MRTGCILTGNLYRDNRPGLAIIANVLTPYRINLHRLIAVGIPELKLQTLVTHGPDDFAWDLQPPESIHVRFFGSKDDSPTARMFRRPISEWRKGRRLIEYLRQNDIRAVIMSGYRYISYLHTIRYCGLNRLPLFVNNDSNIRGDRRLSATKRRVKKQLYSWWLRRSSGVMSMGDYGDQFFTYYGADPSRIYRVPCWPDYDAFAHVNTQRLHQFRQKFGLLPDRKFILFSGRLVALKRVDLLIDAFAAIAAQRPDWDLLIVGDGVLRDELQCRVPVSLRQRVAWTGFLDGPEIALAYHAAEVLVVPSDRDAWGLVVLEAMAAGLTVVASDVVGASHELVTDGVSGRIFATGDCESLGQALQDVTHQDHIASYKQQATAALHQYRQRVDPVAEIRRALINVGVLKHSAPE